MKSFAQLLYGRTDCFGIYRVTETRDDGKKQGQASTYPNDKYPDVTLTDEHWAEHLGGKSRLGIVPVLVDGTCSWFAIDIDVYPIDQTILVKEVEKRDLPLIVCRSKSNGAHLYCFLKDAIQASLAVKLARKWATDLGFKSAEVFPKQTSFSHAAAKGNWINMPYFNSEDSDSYAFGLSGEQLSLEEFEQFAVAKTINEDEAKGYLNSNPNRNEENILNQSPPCIVALLTNGVPEGGRNVSLTQFAVYYQKIDKYLDTNDWKDKTFEINQLIFDPPLKYDEANHIVKSFTQKTYQYSCTKEPMCSLCDKEECIKRELGVGENLYGNIEILSIIKIDTDPPIWVLNINDVDIKMSTETMLTPRKFRFAIAEKLNMIVPQLKQSNHDKLIAPIMEQALTVEPADEITPQGKVMSAFVEWTENVAFRAKSREDMMKGLPFYDSKADCVYFRSEDFLKAYISKHRDNIKDRMLWAYMRDAGFNRKQLRVGKATPEWFWYYPLHEVEPWFTTEIGDRF